MLWNLFTSSGLIDGEIVYKKLDDDIKVCIILYFREHDKDPDTFFQVLYQLTEAGLNFRFSVLGESFTDTPPIFNEARMKLANFIHHWGYADSKERYMGNF